MHQNVFGSNALPGPTEELKHVQISSCSKRGRDGKGSRRERKCRGEMSRREKEKYKGVFASAN